MKIIFYHLKNRIRLKYRLQFFVMNVFFMLLLFSSCSTNRDKKNSLSASFSNNTEQVKIEPIDASTLELTPLEYLDWLRSNKGLTYTILENDSVMISLMYQPIALEAAMGMESTGMTYQQLLESKKGFHYFLVDCLYKKQSVINNNQKKDFLNLVKNNIHIIENANDTVKNSIIESFASTIMNKPDNLIIMAPDKDSPVDLKCSIDIKKLGINDFNIQIPKKQFELFPKLKI